MNKLYLILSRMLPILAVALFSVCSNVSAELSCDYQSRLVASDHAHFTQQRIPLEVKMSMNVDTAIREQLTPRELFIKTENMLFVIQNLDTLHGQNFFQVSGWFNELCEAGTVPTLRTDNNIVTEHLTNWYGTKLVGGLDLPLTRDRLQGSGNEVILSSTIIDPNSVDTQQVFNLSEKLRLENLEQCLKTTGGDPNNPAFNCDTWRVDSRGLNEFGLKREAEKFEQCLKEGTHSAADCKSMYGPQFQDDTSAMVDSPKVAPLAQQCLTRAKIVTKMWELDVEDAIAATVEEGKKVNLPQNIVDIMVAEVKYVHKYAGGFAPLFMTDDSAFAEVYNEQCVDTNGGDSVGDPTDPAIVIDAVKPVSAASHDVVNTAVETAPTPTSDKVK